MPWPRARAFAVCRVQFSIYGLKPRFQALLRPAVRRLDRAGVTANQVTVSACVISVLLGLWLYAAAPAPWCFLLVPGWMLLRMALNAIDGMLARECGHRSVLGAYLNELADVLSDACLYLPFARVAPFEPLAIAAVVLLAALSEMAGVVGPMVGASRRYEGPMGKSDRAFVFGALGLAVACWARPSGSGGWQLPDSAWLTGLMPLVAVLTAGSIYNRIQAGRREAHERSVEAGR